MPVTRVGPAVAKDDPKVQLVVTTGVPAVIFAEQSADAAAGHVIVGAALAIVKTCVQLAVLPNSSVTV